MPTVRYHKFSTYLKSRFGGPVRKLGLDAGFSCPNRDGSLSAAGCTFCQPRSFLSPHAGAARPLAQQLQAQILQGRSRGYRLFMAYFQAYSNTYGSLPELKAAYDAVRQFPEIKALAIGTRPDCVNEEILDLIAGYARDYEVWLEYGLQSIHAETLRRVNRGHDGQAFLQAVMLTRQRPEIKICAHVILGLPGEGEPQEAETAATLARLRLEGVKFHPLYAVAGTQLAEEHAQGRFIPLEREEYARRVVRFLELLWPQTVVQRLTADCSQDLLLAPDWLGDKPAVLRAIEQRLEQEDTRQGKCYKSEKF